MIKLMIQININVYLRFMNIVFRGYVTCQESIVCDLCLLVIVSFGHDEPSGSSAFLEGNSWIRMSQLGFVGIFVCSASLLE